MRLDINELRSGEINRMPAHKDKFKTGVSSKAYSEGHKRIFGERLERREETKAEIEKREANRKYAHAKEAPQELLDYTDEINEKHRRLNIKRRGLTTYHPSIYKFLKPEHQKKYLVKLKTLSQDKYDSTISIEIFKNFTQIFSHRYLQGILIDNSDIAKTMRQIFEVAWEKAEPTLENKGG